MSSHTCEKCGMKFTEALTREVVDSRFHAGAYDELHSKCGVLCWDCATSELTPDSKEKGAAC